MPRRAKLRLPPGRRGLADAVENTSSRAIAYGLLLNACPGWTRWVRSTDDLATLVMSALIVQLAADHLNPPPDTRVPSSASRNSSANGSGRNAYRIAPAVCRWSRAADKGGSAAVSIPRVQCDPRCRHGVLRRLPFFRAVRHAGGPTTGTVSLSTDGGVARSCVTVAISRSRSPRARRSRWAVSPRRNVPHGLGSRVQ